MTLKQQQPNANARFFRNQEPTGPIPAENSAAAPRELQIDCASTTDQAFQPPSGKSEGLGELSTAFSSAMTIARYRYRVEEDR